MKKSIATIERIRVEHGNEIATIRNMGQLTEIKIGSVNGELLTEIFHPKELNDLVGKEVGIIEANYNVIGFNGNSHSHKGLLFQPVNSFIFRGNDWSIVRLGE